MPINDASTNAGGSDSPSLRQRIASAAGHRHAEAKALAERAGDRVRADDAITAVREAHGDIESGTEPRASTQGELASAADAAAVRDREPNERVQPAEE